MNGGMEKIAEATIILLALGFKVASNEWNRAWVLFVGD